MSEATQLKLIRFPAYILFFLMLFVPATYQPIKACFIIVVLASIITEALIQKRISVHRTVAVITVMMSAAGILFINIGMLNRNPGALNVLPLYVLWPILYLFFIAGSARLDVLSGLMRVLVVSAIAVSIYSLLYILHAAALLPAFLYYELDQGQSIGFYQGHIQYALNSISSLIFLVPFLVAALVLWPSEIKPPVARRWLWVALLLSILPVILSERKVLWLLVAAAPFMAIGIRLILLKQGRDATRETVRRATIGIALASVALLLVLRFALNFDFSALGGIVSDALNVSSGTSEDVIIRKAQYVSMMSEWGQSPLLGSGLGAVASYVRNSEQPWTYELSYVALLFHTGIVGLLVYASGAAWIFWNSIRVVRTDSRLGLLMAPVLIGTTCFLIANATNPYLEKYDYLWVLFLPVSIINLWLMQRDDARERQVQNAPV